MAQSIRENLMPLAAAMLLSLRAQTQRRIFRPDLPLGSPLLRTDQSRTATRVVYVPGNHKEGELALAV